MQQKAVFLELTEAWYDFLEQQSNSAALSLADFSAFLQNKTQQQSVERRQMGGEQESWIDETYNTQADDIAILVVLLYRYAKNYIKKGLAESKIQTADEFAFLITLVTFESLTKSELIQKMVMEKTSGTEVIKRLVKNGLMHEFADTDDKRSIRVALTPLGRQELFAALPRMAQVTKLVSGNLNPTEIQSLSHLLRKLDHAHNLLYMQYRQASLEELQAQMDQL